MRRKSDQAVLGFDALVEVQPMSVSPLDGLPYPVGPSAVVVPDFAADTLPCPYCEGSGRDLDTGEACEAFAECRALNAERQP